MPKGQPANGRDLLDDIENLALHPIVRHNAAVRPTAVQREEKKHWKRNAHRPGNTRRNDFEDINPTTLTARGAVQEALQCLKCADAPCQKGCPTSIDIKMFIQCIATENFYGAAKIIFSDNPLGLSCGMVCPTEDLCVGGCNLAGTEMGPINIGGLQAFATSMFKKMQVPLIRNPELPPADQMSASFSQKIAIIGAGPAGVSCATFLARLGYSDIDVFEAKSYAGGLSSSEIPQYRLDSESVMWEVSMMKELGVRVHTGRALGRDFTVTSLRNDGYAAVLCGVGLPQAKSIHEFEGLTAEHGFYTSKTFLPRVCEASKVAVCESCKGSQEALPRLFGRVLVLGVGDTAFDCAGSAFRCGAARVIVTFRRSTADMRCIDEEFEMAKEERTEFLPYCAPKQVLRNHETGRIVGLELYKMERDDNGEYRRDEDQVLRIKCDFVILAFGSSVPDELQSSMAPMTFSSSGYASVNKSTMASLAAPWLFAGGDLAGSGITVEAANDGKTAAWHMHELLQGRTGSPSVPRLPMFHTAIDTVDISVDFVGIKFLNPFGVASATGATSAAMIARAFEAGWGFAVTKTFSLDKDSITNVSPRIIRGSTTGPQYGPHQSSFLNIELISEKSCAYWLSSIRQLKHDHPQHRIIASIMCCYNEQDWKELTQLAQASGPDALELNLSFPHCMGERGMGLALGQKEDLVRQVCQWVKQVATIPFFAKLTPNVTDICDIARGAKEGGATGVTAINTVSGLMGLTSAGLPWPRVGSKALTTYGGMSGNATRPIALRAVSAIGNYLPNFPIMATGGCDSGSSAIEFLHCGASLVQICSAVQNQDFTVVQDYIMALKAHLYMQSRSDLKQWNHQMPPSPHPTLQHGTLPRFGAFQRKRWEQAQAAVSDGPSLVATMCGVGEAVVSQGEVRKQAQMLDEAGSTQGEIPRVNDIIGKALSHITCYNNLDQSAQVVAVVNDDLCVNCGKCYMTCADSGYQAITFDAQTHQPRVTDDCTGCTLCVSVCPIPDCITMVPRTTPYAPKRVLPLGSALLPVA